jgi:hypothetical protein
MDNGIVNSEWSIVNYCSPIKLMQTDVDVFAGLQEIHHIGT